MSLLQEDASKMQLYAYTLPGGHPLPVGSHLLFLCLCSIINWFNEINWEKKIFIYVIKSTEKRKYLIPLIPFHFRKCLRFRLLTVAEAEKKQRWSRELLWKYCGSGWGGLPLLYMTKNYVIVVRLDISELYYKRVSRFRERRLDCKCWWSESDRGRPNGNEQRRRLLKSICRYDIC